MPSLRVLIEHGDGHIEPVGNVWLRTEYCGVVRQGDVERTGAWCRTLEEASYEAFAELGSEAEFVRFESRHLANLGDYEDGPFRLISSHQDEAIEAGRAKQAADEREPVESEEA